MSDRIELDAGHLRALSSWSNTMASDLSAAVDRFQLHAGTRSGAFGDRPGAAEADGEYALLVRSTVAELEAVQRDLASAAEGLAGGASVTVETDRGAEAAALAGSRHADG